MVMVPLVEFVGGIVPLVKIVGLIVLPVELTFVPLVDVLLVPLLVVFADELSDSTGMEHNATISKHEIFILIICIASL